MAKRVFLLTNSILLRRYEEDKTIKDKIILEEKNIYFTFIYQYVQLPTCNVQYNLNHRLLVHIL